MIELSGLRRYVTDAGVARLEADIKITDAGVEFLADTLYFEIDANYGGMLVDDTYDPFLLVALFFAMNFKTDLRIRGNVSKRLYKNLTWYGQKILCDFDPDLAPVKIFVEGFAPANATGILIGTGISCGVDSLSTLYDRFICEDDPDYKVNALFFFNCGSNGIEDDDITSTFAQSRLERSIALATELGLPLVPVDTNLHHFWRREFGHTLFFLSLYSCVLALQNVIRRYYIGSAISYGYMKKAIDKTNCDFAEFCESYFLPLIGTERTEFISDGCQYRRVDKIKKIADWDIAHKYLNVCHVYRKDSSNCGGCAKCLRTLLPLEIMGKLDDFANIFDLAAYRERALNFKAQCVALADKELFCREIVEFAAENNFPMPTRRDCYTLDRQVVIFDNEK